MFGEDSVELVTGEDAVVVGFAVELGAELIGFVKFMIAEPAVV